MAFGDPRGFAELEFAAQQRQGVTLTADEVVDLYGSWPEAATEYGAVIDALETAKIKGLTGPLRKRLVELVESLGGQS